MTRQYLPLKIDITGKTSIGSLDREAIDWLSGWYIAISDISITSSDGYFVIPYASGQKLYDRFTTALKGGATEANVLTTETYVCPIRASGEVSFADVYVYPGTYTVDNITPANLCYIRLKDRQSCFYVDGDGYQNEIYALFGYTSQIGITPDDAAHYFYYVYTDKANPGVFLQVPASDPGIPNGKDIDLYVPASVNISNLNWSVGMYQVAEILKQPTVAPSPSTNIDFSKNSYTIGATATDYTGATSFGTIDVSNVLSSKTIFGYINGVEANVVIDSIARPGSDVDIIINSADPPATASVYFNGSSLGNCPLAPLQQGDIIRIYVPITI